MTMRAFLAPLLVGILLASAPGLAQTPHETATIGGVPTPRLRAALNTEPKPRQNAPTHPSQTTEPGRPSSATPSKDYAAPESLASLAARLLPAVVNISITTSESAPSDD